MGDDLILRMAQVQRARVSAVPWRSLPPVMQDAYYDAMHAALKELREPTEDMIMAALDNYAEKSPFDSPFGPEGSFASAWRAMVDKLLEVK